MDQHGDGACTGYMCGHGFRTEGGLRGEHAIDITKEGTFAVFLRNEGTKKEIGGIFLTKAKSISRYTSYGDGNNITNVP